MPPNKDATTLATAAGDRCDLTAVFIDIYGSLAMKMSMTEGAWLQQGLLFMNIVETAVKHHTPTAKIKPLGDGALIFIPNSDSTLEAIHLAIEVQEEIAEANERVDGAMGKANFAASAAITTGSALPVVIQGATDYWGFTVDKSQRLCSAASPNAIFIDPATYAATNFRKVRSKVGEVLRREPDEYAGPREQITAKGVLGQVEYHEVVWGRQLFGVRSDYVSNISTAETTDKRTAPRALPTVATNRTERVCGRVKMFDETRGFGFITSDDGEDFFTAPNLMVYPDDSSALIPGRRVAFVALPASEPGRNRRASALLVDQCEADGEIVALPDDKPFGFVRVEEADGRSIDVFLSKADLPPGSTVGSEVAFTVHIADRGARAADITLIDTQHAA